MRHEKASILVKTSWAGIDGTRKTRYKNKTSKTSCVVIQEQSIQDLGMSKSTT